MLAGRLERVPLEVPALGGLKLALEGKAAVGRCSYCHDDVTGTEPDLVACAACTTIIHDACFRENGRCPIRAAAGGGPTRAVGP